MRAPRQAVVYLRVVPQARQVLKLEQQLEHIQAFRETHAVQELGRFEDLDTEGFEQLRAAAQAARAQGLFVLMDHVDDFEQVISILNAEGANFISAQSSTQALYSFFNDPSPS